jgi:CAAX protease family protein
VGACVVLVVTAELVFLVGGLVAGTLAGIGAISVLLVVGTAARGQLGGRAAIALAVVPLLRVLSIAIPSLLVPTWIWYAEIGVPVLVATVLAAAAAGITLRSIGVRPAARSSTIVAAIVGLGLGLIAFALMPPEAVTVSRSPLTIMMAALAIVIGGALAEELLFRGLIQQVADEVTGGFGVLASAALCTLVYLASANLRYTLFMAAVAVALGLVTRQHRSLLPAVACHGVLLVSQLILWPILLG